MKSKIDMEQLRVEIRRLHRTHTLYKVLRDELGILGLWKARKRGNPRKGYEVAHGGNKDAAVGTNDALPVEDYTG